MKTRVDYMDSLFNIEIGENNAFSLLGWSTLVYAKTQAYIPLLMRRIITSVLIIISIMNRTYFDSWQKRL